MARKIKSLDEAPIDIIEAIKRGFIHRGLIPRKFRRNDPTSPEFELKKTHKSPGQSKSESSHDQAETKPKESGETYPERVAEGESDEEIEKENDQSRSKDKLKSEIEGSKTAKGPEELVEITEKSQDVLFEADTVWPFTFFPDTIKLDREKLTIANRFFWRVANITSVPVGEIMSAEADVGPFFGSLVLTFRFFTNNERRINFLWRWDAIQLQRMIHGYIIAHRREIDVSNVNKDDLIKLLCDLGQGASD